MLERFCARLTATMRKLTDSRAELVATTRFFRNPKVTMSEIVATAATRTAVAAAGRHVVLIEDTSRDQRAGRGTLGEGSGGQHRALHRRAHGE